MVVVWRKRWGGLGGVDNSMSDDLRGCWGIGSKKDEAVMLYFSLLFF